MSEVVFYDPACPRPYDTRTLATEAIPGTEASVVRIADALGACVVQHNRTDQYGRYRSPDARPEADRVVVLRDSRALETARQWYPHARLYLWLHDKLRPRSKRGRRLAATGALLRELTPTLVCVSDTHRADVEATLRWIGLAGTLATRTLYNPVDESLAPDNSAVNPDKLVFFSSPNKGLAFAVDAFRALRRSFPGLQLVVGNPGYRQAAVSSPGVHYLGALPQARIHAEVRTALCTFHPNFRIPETFGLVFAESKALGTPVLTHDFGAAAEILADPAQLLPVTQAHRAYEAAAGLLPPRWRALSARLAARCGLFDAYIERIRAWRAGGRPHVGPDPRFALRTVAQQWRTLLAPTGSLPAGG